MQRVDADDSLVIGPKHTHARANGMTVTVVIPTYNQARFLSEAIASVLAQTRQPDEIVVVDDGSTDQPENVVAQFKSVRLIRQKNAGLSAARNTGLRNCKTRYIIFLDADDRLLPNALEAGLACINERPDCAFVYGGYRRVSEDGLALEPDRFTPVEGNAYLALLRGNIIGMHATVLHNRDRLLAVNGYDETLRRCEDYDLYLRVTRQYPIASHPSIIAEYRRHGQNMSSDYVKQIEAMLRILERNLTSDPVILAAIREGRRAVCNFYVPQMTRAAATRWRTTHDVSALVHDLIEVARWLPYLKVGRVLRFFKRRASRLVPPQIKLLAERRTPAVSGILSPGTNLPEILEYTGEFGPELILFNPFCRWLAKEGLLKHRRIKTYAGMRCFYDDLDCSEIIEKTESRRDVPPDQRSSWLPVKNEHDFDRLGRCPFHIYPDLRSRFLRLPLICTVRLEDRPLLIIHNKHVNEWYSGPVNHISLDTLDTIFASLKKYFTIVYVRHDGRERSLGYSEDNNTAIQFNDQAVLDRHPEIHNFTNLYASHRERGGTQDLNTFKNTLYSRCYHFISSQGGGAHQIALFSGSLLAILHRRGEETKWAYSDGYYQFMATIPPVLAICRSGDELVNALPLFLNTKIVDERVLLDSQNDQLLSRFSPKSRR